MHDALWMTHYMHIMTKHLHVSLICSKDLIHEIFCFFQMQLCKPRRCCHVPLETRAFLLTTPTNKSHLFRFFL